MTITCGDHRIIEHQKVTQNDEFWNSKVRSINKSGSDHHGLGYQNGKNSHSQGVFVKASQVTASPPIVKVSYFQKGKGIAHSSSVHQGKNNMFIPTCHFCHVKGHIRSNCFKRIKYINKKGYVL